MTIPQMIDQYANQTALQEGKTVMFSDDYPFRTNRMNSGFVIVKAGEKSQRFLKAWWEVDSSEWDCSSPFEQEVLNIEVEAQNVAFTSAVQRLTLRPTDERWRYEDEKIHDFLLQPFDNPVVHITHYDKDQRDRVILYEYGINKIHEAIRGK